MPATFRTPGPAPDREMRYRVPGRGLIEACGVAKVRVRSAVSAAAQLICSGSRPSMIVASWSPMLRRPSRTPECGAVA